MELLIMNGYTMLKRCFTQMKKEAGGEDYVLKRREKLLKNGRTKVHHIWYQYKDRPLFAPEGANYLGKKEMLEKKDEFGNPKYNEYDTTVVRYQEYLGKEIPIDIPPFYPYQYIEEGKIHIFGKHLIMEEEIWEDIKRKFKPFEECNVEIAKNILYS